MYKNTVFTKQLLYIKVRVQTMFCTQLLLYFLCTNKVLKQKQVKLGETSAYNTPSNDAYMGKVTNTMIGVFDGVRLITHRYS